MAMVLDTSLLKIQHYKIPVEGKWSNIGKVAIEKGAFGSPSTTIGLLTIYSYIMLRVCKSFQYLLQDLNS